jgi:hypothetical protein
MVAALLALGTWRRALRVRPAICDAMMTHHTPSRWNPLRVMIVVDIPPSGGFALSHEFQNVKRVSNPTFIP